MMIKILNCKILELLKNDKYILTEIVFFLFTFIIYSCNCKFGGLNKSDFIIRKQIARHFV